MAGGRPLDLFRPCLQKSWTWPLHSGGLESWQAASCSVKFAASTPVEGQFIIVVAVVALVAMLRQFSWVRFLQSCTKRPKPSRPYVVLSPSPAQTVSPLVLTTSFLFQRISFLSLTAVRFSTIIVLFASAFSPETLQQQIVGFFVIAGLVWCLPVCLTLSM